MAAAKNSKKKTPEVHTHLLAEDFKSVEDCEDAISTLLLRRDSLLGRTDAIRKRHEVIEIRRLQDEERDTIVNELVEGNARSKPKEYKELVKRRKAIFNGKHSVVVPIEIHLTPEFDGDDSFVYVDTPLEEEIESIKEVKQAKKEFIAEMKAFSKDARAFTKEYVKSKAKFLECTDEEIADMYDTIFFSDF